MKVKYSKNETEEEKQNLISLLDRTDRTIYACVKNVSRSGMSRDIDFFVFETEGNKVIKHWLSYKIAGLLDYPFNDKKETVKVGGCGMDMCFSVVYNLGRLLYPNGDGKTVIGINGDTEPETDGGYLLKYKLL